MIDKCAGRSRFVVSTCLVFLLETLALFSSRAHKPSQSDSSIKLARFSLQPIRMRAQEPLVFSAKFVARDELELAVVVVVVVSDR